MATNDTIDEFTMQQKNKMTLTFSNPSSQPDEICMSKKQTRCGLGLFHPLWLQRFVTAKWFLVVIGFFVLIQSMMVSGITSSVITTIETRYGLRSAESGLVVSAFDIGSLAVVVFISYFGGRSHRARWVGCGAIGVALGAVLFSLPQFLAYPYQLPNLASEYSTKALCSGNNTNSSKMLCEAQEPNSIYLFIFVLSNLIIGIGSTPIYTLGSTFIYDNVPRDDASVYVSILYAIGAVGPAAGYLLGAFFLSFYIDLDSLLPSDDPRFLGAWWLGYLVCAGFIVLASIVLLMFPRKLRVPAADLETPTASTPMSPMSGASVTETDVTIDSIDTSISFGADLRELPKAFMSLLSNPIFMFVTCAATLEFSIVTAFLTFIPKFLQSHFNSDTVHSSIITGAVLVPSAGSGILLGGYIVKRLRLNITGCAQTALLSNLLSFALFISVFFIKCDTSSVAGINFSFLDPVSGSESGSLQSQCNSKCSCDGTPYKPLCHDGVTYFNPCYAGCQLSVSITNMTLVEYQNCSCLAPSPQLNVTISAVQGECDRDCSSALIPFLVCLFLVTMATVCAHTPSLMVTYRCVRNEERSFAAGIQFMFFRALAYIPAPIYFGVAIDQACLLWDGSTDQCSSYGACQFYDTDKFRVIFFGVAFTCKVLAALFMFLSWIFCRRNFSTHTHTTRWRKQRRMKQKEKLKRMKSKNRSLGDGASLPQPSAHPISQMPLPHNPVSSEVSVCRPGGNPSSSPPTNVVYSNC